MLIAPFLPFRARYRFVIQAWCRCATWLAKVVVGIRYEVHGLDNIPQQPCVILAKHQSTWETFFLSAFYRCSTRNGSGSAPYTRRGGRR